MILPWVSRHTLEAASERALKAESALEVHKALSAAAIERANLAVDLALNQVAEVKGDNKLLIDRIVQMSGQPAIFHPAPVLPAAPEAAPSRIPGPKTRKSFDDVHEAAREAIRTGKLNLGADT